MLFSLVLEKLDCGNATLVCVCVCVIGKMIKEAATGKSVAFSIFKEEICELSFSINLTKKQINLRILSSSFLFVHNLFFLFLRHWNEDLQHLYTSQDAGVQHF